MTGGAAGPSAPWPAQRPAPAGRRPWRSIGLTLLVTVAVAALGPLLGWLWHRFAPRFGVIKVADGFVYAEPEPEQAVAADGWFVLLGAGAGVLVAVLAWILLRRRRGVAVLLGVALGSLVAAGLAGWVGTAMARSDFQRARDSAAVGARLDAPLGLRVTDLDADDLWPPWPTGVIAVQALVAVFCYATCAGFHAGADLSPRRSGPPELDQFGGLDPLPGSAQFGSAQFGSAQFGSAQFGSAQFGPAQFGPAQFGPGATGSSDSDTGTART